MKIRILTHHTVHNHGAVLQLYALSQVLKKYDSGVCALNYSKNFDFLDETANTKYNISIKSIPYYLGYLYQKGLKRTIFNIKKKRILEKFKEKNKLVGEYYSRCKDLDGVFVGSDEVFSIEPGLNPFFWGMGVPAEHIFAYGGCFGPTDISFIYKKYAVEYIKAGIERFEKISVRDLNSQTIIKEISGCDVPQVCDPVILYGFLKEKKLFKKPMEEKYLLVYAYDNNMNDKTEVESIKSFAKKKNLKTVTVGFYHEWCDKSINAYPIELLSWIANAEIVVTDTFHGTVMSLIMNAQFATKIRGNRHKLGYLLSEYRVTEREINNFSELDSVFQNKIDYEEVNKKIENKRRDGLSFIEECIHSIAK
ncbi:MAG: polysaccharide pyruvyl transferase family protein [Clostridiales bacterium]|nr:polysaccharide pyruvyl transferase family protein [Clostridiales bacterium]